MEISVIVTLGELGAGNREGKRREGRVGEGEGGATHLF
jgi:hypothetical protein